MHNVESPMDRPVKSDKLIAALKTACACMAVEAAIVLLIGAYFNSYVGALGVSLVILGPVSLWIAPSIYGYFLDTTPK